MEPVAIKLSFKETYRQLLFIDKYIVSESYKAYLRRGLVLLAISVAVILIYFSSNSDSTAAWIFLIPVFWISFFLYLLYAKWKTHLRRKYLLRDIAKGKVVAPHTLKLTFNEEKIIIFQSDEATEVKWSAFRAYLEEPDTIYLFQENPYEALSFSSKEIGAAAVAALKKLAVEKLPHLKSEL